MANVISLSLAISVAGTGVSVNGSNSFAANQVTAGQIGNMQVVGTSSEALLFGDAVPNAGYLAIFNLDPTNYVEIDGVNTFDGALTQKITAGKFVLLMCKTSTIYAKANTGACNCWVVAVTL